MNTNDTYRGMPVANFSPDAKDSYFRFMDNLVELSHIREVTIDHHPWDTCSEVRIVCDDLRTLKIHPSMIDTFKIYEPPKQAYKLPLTRKPTPKKVIFSGPATTIIWKDGTKTTVKCQEGDTFDPETGIALCYLKKLLGNKGNYNKIFKEAMSMAKNCMGDTKDD